EKVIKVYKNFSIVYSLLGEAYLNNENSGKAVRVFEKLVSLERNNAGYVRQLAQAYAIRGWYKKAEKQFRRALLIDEDNISLWLGLINCYLATNNFTGAEETVLEGLEVSNENGWDNIELYYHIIQLDISTSDYDSMVQHLDEIKNKAIEKEEERANVAWFLAVLAKKIHSIGLYEESSAIIETAFTLLPGDNEVESIKKEIDVQYSIITGIKLLKDDSSINGALAEMLDFELHKCDDKNCFDCEITQFFYEMDVIDEMELFRKDILRLKNSYPELYNMKKNFFDVVLNRRKEQALMEKYFKKLGKYQKLCPERFECDEEEEIQQPYKRTEPKVGRNDPCPCGSGKKYKKCCGANV
ncbi:MAG: SEC-C metal-binding domain-containing protein, partial [Clostridia bacterium]|nr:SEC-C metal-binding domain-containing protein [Clostridia bacterium]